MTAPAPTTLRARLDATPWASPLGTQEYFVNMGPQHPSTHGVLRLVLKLDGETVREVVPVLGYIHRGIEKICEHSNYRQLVHLTDRMDYLSALANNWAVTRVVEKAAGLETNGRIEAIRTLVTELQRIHSHQLWWGVFGMDLGAFTPFFYGFRDREILTDVFERTIGGRLTLNYIQPGGVMHDIHPEFVRDVKAFMAVFRPRLDEYEALLSENVIVQERLRGVGVLSAADAVALGATGPVLRASGVAHDLRKAEPYGLYGQVQFDVPIGSRGDCWDRYAVRMCEMRQSLRIVDQLIDHIPEGKHFLVKPAAKIKVQPGVWYSHLETARGVLGAMLVSTGGEAPYRVHLRTPNFNNLWTVTAMAPGGRVGDLVAILSSLDLVVPDIDR
ncbi:MAG: NADH-quinone oxidoreductase subunit D [Deltaproteobacteria bacterium]|nr:NADH-quinone oxidoreductase subunit D [Deltaproteobacteria bacterium]